jgi:hypothetical protein
MDSTATVAYKYLKRLTQAHFVVTAAHYSSISYVAQALKLLSNGVLSLWLLKDYIYKTRSLNVVIERKKIPG